MQTPFFQWLAISCLGFWITGALAQTKSAEPINLTPQANSVYVVQDHRWAPLAFRNQQGQPDGLIIDIWRLLGQKMQRPIEWSIANPRSWNGQSFVTA